MKIAREILFIVCSLTMVFTQTSALDLVVSKDGSGDFLTIQEAIDAAPGNLSSPYDEKLFIEQVWRFHHVDHTGTGSVNSPRAPFRQVFIESSFPNWQLAYYVDLPGDLFRKDAGYLARGVYICSLVSFTSRANIKIYIP